MADIRRISIICFGGFILFVFACIIAFQNNPNFQNNTNKSSSGITIIAITPTINVQKPIVNNIQKATPTTKATTIPKKATAIPVVGPHLTACSNNAILQNCDGADPVVDGCVNDAGLPNKQKSILLSGKQIGEVDLEYSKKCNSYWVQAIVYPQNVQSVNGVIIQTVWANGHLENVSSNPADPGSALFVQSHMTYQQSPVQTGKAGATVELSTGTALPIILF